MGAGRVGERDFGDGLGDESGLVPGEVEDHGVGGVVGPAAGGVGEEMVYGDVGDEGLVGRFAVLDAEDAGGAEDGVVEVENALLNEGEDGDGGDGLGDRGDAEEGFLLGLREILLVGHAYGFVIDEAAVAGDGDGGGGDGELAAEFCGDAAHLAPLLSGRASVLGLREGPEGGETYGRGGGGGEEISNERAAVDGLADGGDHLIGRIGLGHRFFSWGGVRSAW